jgi:hypothetical protein
VVVVDGVGWAIARDWPALAQLPSSRAAPLAAIAPQATERQGRNGCSNGLTLQVIGSVVIEWIGERMD